MAIARLSRLVSARMGGDRTLLSENSDPEERLKFIRNKQWIKGAPAYAPQLQPKADTSMSAAAHKMMANMNYIQGAGLGASASGATEPASSSMVMRQNTFGLGYTPEKSALPPAAAAAAASAAKTKDLQGDVLEEGELMGDWGEESVDQRGAHSGRSKRKRVD